MSLVVFCNAISSIKAQFLLEEQNAINIIEHSHACNIKPPMNAQMDQPNDVPWFSCWKLDEHCLCKMLKKPLVSFLPWVFLLASSPSHVST